MPKRPRIGAYVRIVPLNDDDPVAQPGHALYRAEGTVEEYWTSETGAEGVKVLLEKPRNSRGLLLQFVDPDRIVSARRR